MEQATNASAANASAANTSAYALGVDVSKDKLDAALLAPTGQAWSTTVPNDTGGFDALLRWTSRRLDLDAEERVGVCLEASGGYEAAAARFLHGQGLTVSVVNPRRLVSYANSQLRRSKTDRADARLLARFCQRESDQLNAWAPPEPDQQALKEMNRGLQSLKKERDRLTNQLNRTPNDAVAEALEAVLERVDEQIERLERRIDAHVETSGHLARNRELLETIPGIGAASATQVLAELGQTSRFESARQVAAYAGLTPRHYKSGTSVERPPHLSKIGNARLRKAMCFPALTALRCNAAIKAFAERLAQRGKAKMVIVAAAMRKLLHICYGVLKNGQPFDASLHPGVT